MAKDGWLALRDTDVEAVLAAQGFGAERPRSGALVIARLDPPRVVWANRAAVALFEADTLEALQAELFAGRGRAGLSDSVARLDADGTPRLERLRLIRGFRSRTLTVLLGRATLPDRRDVAVIAVPAATFAEDPAFGEAGLSTATEPATTEATAEAATPGLPPTPDGSGAGAEAHGVEAHGGAPGRPLRLLWQTDANHRLLRVSGGRADLLGVGDGTGTGQPFTALVSPAAADIDLPDQGLAAALAGAAPFSGLRLRWPLRTERASLAVTLGAVPLFNHHGRFDGFRGFGVVEPGLPQPLPRVGEEDGSGERPTRGERPALPMADNQNEFAPLLPPEHREADEQALPPDGKVVAFRSYQTFSAALIAAATSTPGGSASPVEGDGPSGIEAQPEDVADLSTVERSNFDAIRRALRQPGALSPEPAGGEPAGAEPTRPEMLGLLEALDVALLVAGSDRLLFANPSFFALTGYPTLEALDAAGGPVHLFGGASPEAVLGAAEERAFPLVSAGGIVPAQGRLQRVTWGGAAAMAFTLRPAANLLAKVQMLEGEVKRRELEAAELRATLDRVADNIVTVDRQGRVLTLNGTAERLFGYPAAQAAGEPLAMLVGPDAQIAVNAGGSAAELGKAGLDVTGRTAEGRSVPLRMTWQGLTHGRACVVLRDLGERAALQRDLDAARERLDQALAGRPDFLAKISHEIRTPLNAILGFAELMREERFGPLGNDRYKGYLGDIYDSGTAVLALVNDLLDLSTMEAGGAAMHPAPLDVNRAVSERVGEMQATAHRQRVIMRLSLLPHLAPAVVDEDAFRQIMEHVLANAIRLNEPGGQVIVSTAMSEAGAVAVRVRDTGTGMSDAEIAAAMEPFRLGRGSPVGGGNGLGLPLAHALAGANGATMAIRSGRNEGTLVEVVLPAAGSSQRHSPAA